MSRPARRKMKAAALLRHAVQGPSFNLGFTVAGKPTWEQASKAAAEAYQIWADTWLTPAILELVPELKSEELAHEVIRKVRSEK